MTKIIYTSDVHGYLFPTDYLDRNIKKKDIYPLSTK